MTETEAIDIIKAAIAQIEWDYPMDYSAAFDKAIEALEKRDVSGTNVGYWISVKDRLPQEGKTVLVARKYVQPGKREKRYVETAELTGLLWSSANDEYRVHPQFHTDPYAWMPLPEAPKEEEK